MKIGEPLYGYLADTINGLTLENLLIEVATAVFIMLWPIRILPRREMLLLLLIIED